jgi:protein-tyrosine phosphatase
MSFKETSAEFIENQCLFGAFPTQHQVSELEEWGIDIFVNLTNIFERKIYPYTSTKKIINFPIPDRSVPKNIQEFCGLVIKISDEIDAGKKIYIHCKAGHGRSGTLVASLLCYRYKISPEESFRKTTEFHSTRPVHARRPRMNDHWKNKGSPQTEEQRKFVKSLFQSYRITFKGDFEKVKDRIMSTYLGDICGEKSDEFLEYRKRLLQSICDNT